MVKVTPGNVILIACPASPAHKSCPTTNDWRSSSKINRLHDVTTSSYRTVAIMYYSSDTHTMIVIPAVIEAAQRQR
jgi:hypothetical protein